MLAFDKHSHLTKIDERLQNIEAAFPAVQFLC